MNVSGHVYDKETNEPLVGVNVVVKETVIGNATDKNGFYSLSSSIKFPCVLRISMIGYTTQEIQITKNYKNLDLFLSVQSLFSEEVVVRGIEKEIEQHNFNRIGSMESMDAATIRETAASSFYQALSNLKGVDVVKQSMNFMTVNARGFNSTENTRFVQIVDGMDNMAPGMNFPIGNIAGLNELDIESIEFLPGPSEVQYGGNALNGILKMTGKDPFEYQGISFYVRPGVGDVKSGPDKLFQYSGKPQIESAIRIAKAFNEKIAFKINVSYQQGLDWYADDTTNIRPGNIAWEYDPGFDAVNKYGDEVASYLEIGDNGQNILVSRTGYNDKDLIDNKSKNLKLNGAIHYRISNKITAILHGNYGVATTSYTGDNRISLSDFSIYQGKAELQGEHFMLRGYSSMQNSGRSYDAKFLAVNLNNQAQSDDEWFEDYYYGYLGTYIFYGVEGDEHEEAREYADRYRLKPGTSEFKTAKKEIIDNPDYSKGAGIYNSSVMYNADGMFDLNKYTGKTKLSLGGNYRFFDLDSKGSIFPDTTGNNITLYEYGGFVETARDFIDDHLSLKASVRYDKSENFKGHFSPRFSALYTLNPDNNFRFSVLTGFRNPGVKEQFINKNLGTARFLGGLKKINKSYNIPLNSIYLENVEEFNEAVIADVDDDENPYSLNQAINNNLSILEEGIVPETQMKEMVPEQVVSFEIGYKTRIAKVLFIDAVYYNSFYRNFIGIMKAAMPRTSPQIDLFTAAKQLTKSTQYQTYYVNVNSQERIGVQGLSVGCKWLLPTGTIFSGNATWSDLNTSVNDPVSPGFNTPEWKANISVQNRKMDRMENNPGFRNIGYKVTWRYQSKFYWESTFGDGWVKPVHTLDIQFSINLPKPKSLVKFGASNFFNDPFTYSFGSPKVGVIYYVSYLIDDIFQLSKK